MQGIQIKLNEKEVTVRVQETLFGLKSQYKPRADVIIYNGFPVTTDRPLRQGDEVVLI